MRYYTLHQRLQILKLYYENQCSVKKTFRALRQFYNPFDRPSEHAIRKLEKKFRETYSLHDNVSVTREKSGRTDENVAAVEMSVTETQISRFGAAGNIWVFLRSLLGQFYKKILVYGHTRSNWFKSCSQTII